MMIIHQVNVPRKRFMWLAWKCWLAWWHGAESFTITWSPDKIVEWEV